MTERILSIVRQQGLLSGRELSALKFSTPTSGMGKDDKVLFFIFPNGANEPALVAKTVRHSGASERVRRGFRALTELNALTTGSPAEPLFAKALHLYDDEENVFSIETACRGSRVHLDARTLYEALRAYRTFAEVSARRARGPLRRVDTYAVEAIGSSALPEEDKKHLLDFFSILSFGDLMLPRLMQLGDVTEDNILISKESISIVDCDSTGLIDLPGFDVFGLLYRYDPRSALVLARTHLPEYFNRLGLDVPKERYDALCLLYYVLERTVRKPYLASAGSAARLIAEYKSISSSTVCVS